MNSSVTPPPTDRPPFADVAVNSPISRGTNSFHYAVPRDMDISIGQLVWVPFGKRRLQGVVLDLLESSAVEGIKDIDSAIEGGVVLTPELVKLARWLADYYAASLFDAIKLMLPPGTERHLVTTISIVANELGDEKLTPKQQALWTLLQERGRLRVEQLRASLKMRDLGSVVGQLARRGLLKREQELHGVKVAAKRETHLRIVDETVEVDLGRAPRQAALLELIRRRRDLTQSEAIKETGSSAAAVAALVKRGLIEVVEREVRRDPMAHRRFGTQASPTLTETQQAVWEEITGRAGDRRSEVFLLHGVTGSGKTEIYLRAIADTLERGKKAIMLVPEIALTPQTIHRFASRFPGAVAIIHSKLSPGEHFDEWRRIRSGAASVVVGSRSALFAPLAPLGLIVLDEEHEWSYKQDKAPRYHARDVAIKLAELSGAQVILGSATPDVETFHKAKTGAYRLLTLPERVMSGTPDVTGKLKPALPPVEVVDMRQELRGGNRSIFSRVLRDSIEVALAAKQQVILFLNRRGTSTFVMCRDCGYVVRCKRCDVSLVYHGDADQLICHECNFRTFVPETCPDCWSGRIRFFGIGTQKLEEETQRQFPGARVLRWDRDVTGGKLAHEELMRKFAEHEADILVGTQMIAKGLDLPLVTLVGVMSADTALHLPDMRASERSFQLLTQVAGRAGRGVLGGKAIIQTYSTQHYCIQAASKHDYEGFYRQEIEFRRQHAYPPFGRLARILFSNISDGTARRGSERMADALRLKVQQEGLPATSVIGPAPAFRRRIRSKFRWQIVVRGPRPEAVLKDVPVPLGAVVDVDPISLL